MLRSIRIGWLLNMDGVKLWIKRYSTICVPAGFADLASFICFEPICQKQLFWTGVAHNLVTLVLAYCGKTALPDAKDVPQLRTLRLYFYFSSQCICSDSNRYFRIPHDWESDEDTEPSESAYIKSVFDHDSDYEGDDYEDAPRSI